MSKDNLRVALIMGSARHGRFCDTITAWAARQLAASGRFELDILDPRQLSLPGWNQQDESADAAQLCQRLAAADAFVVVTPEYNHSFPATLKNLVDLAYDEWQAKPVGFVSYGGISGGLRAVEQLRLVFAELHAVTLRDSVSFAGAWNLFDGRGELLEPQAADSSMARMLARLHWWATALREARGKQPYTEAA